MNQPAWPFPRFTPLVAAGAGGTASIHRAFDRESEKVVALKVFSVAGKDPAVINEIWNREVQSLQRLSHPSIVKFVDAGRADNGEDRFIALEWIEGTTLEKHLAMRGPITWGEFESAFGSEILGALVYAAEQNISHRDLSPKNIMVEPSGTVRIIDFGQAKLREAVPIGVTLQDWRTEPFCPPESDSGTFTLTRDPFSFAAIAVQAVAGVRIDTHEELYRRFDQIDLPTRVRETLSKALDRDPRRRFPTVVEFSIALGGTALVNEEKGIGLVPIRLAPGVAERLAPLVESGDTCEEMVVGSLNELVAISLARDSGGENLRLQLDTERFRIIVDVDSANGDHLVVLSCTQRRFRVDAIYRADKWMPSIKFTAALPKNQLAKTVVADNIRRIYEGLEDFIASSASESAASRTMAAVADWRALLEAMRFLARTSVPALRFSKLEQDGLRLIARVKNPEDAAEEQLRTITVDGKWAFRGEVESVRGNQCVLVSNRRFSIDRLPSEGELEIDWQQTRIALQRQARAVDKLDRNDVPNSALKEMLTGASLGSAEPSFHLVKPFFDKTLDDAKKAVVSRWAAGTSLLVTHGPPGTGKTKLIVELIRQAITKNPECRVLLASQTHVALDNALHRLLAAEPDISCVRIGSGSKEADPRVVASSLEHRSSLLRDSITASSRSYIADQAKLEGVDVGEVELGLRASDLLMAATELARAERDAEEVEQQIERLSARDLAQLGQSSNLHGENTIRLRALETELEELEDGIAKRTAEVEAARQRLSILGKDGKELASMELADLEEWSNLLINDPQKEGIARLVKLSEEWRSRFSQSIDLNAVIVSTSSVVAGTCVGFCREEAASKATFDLCIIDEAGKATTTELLVPIVQSRAVVLFGDHHQLPAVLDHSLKRRETIARFKIRPELVDQQLFEQLSTSLLEGSQARLSLQYRMRGAIGRLVSECFYSGKLEPGEGVEFRPAIDLSGASLETEVTWIDPFEGPGGGQKEQEVGTSYRNLREADCIVALLDKLRAALEKLPVSVSWPTVAVISGYAPQVALIRNQIRKNASLDRLNVDCASVHAFQGREVDICIYSVTRKNPDSQIGMLRDWRHLNVALSRARDFLVIVGSMEFCRSISDPNPFHKLLDFVESNPRARILGWTE